MLALPIGGERETAERRCMVAGPRLRPGADDMPCTSGAAGLSCGRFIFGTLLTFRAIGVMNRRWNGSTQIHGGAREAEAEHEKDGQNAVCQMHCHRGNGNNWSEPSQCANGSGCPGQGADADLSF
jgi:hypothetical protein